MPITDYSDLTAGQKYYEGQLVSAEPGYIMTGINEESGVLTFGRAVVQGTADKGVRLPVDANSLFKGIAYHSDTREKREGYSLDADGDMGYPSKEPVGYVKRGTVAVKIDGAVTAGDTAFWRHTAAGNERKGVFRADADTADAVEVPNSQFLDSGTAGDVVRLSINLP